MRKPDEFAAAGSWLAFLSRIKYTSLKKHSYYDFEFNRGQANEERKGPRAQSSHSCGIFMTLLNV